jgi:hypothetical protein
LAHPVQCEADGAIKRSTYAAVAHFILEDIKRRRQSQAA